MNKAAALTLVVAAPLLGALVAPSVEGVVDRAGRRMGGSLQPEGDAMPPMPPPPGEHHAWLEQLVGTWRVESVMGQGDDAFECEGTDTVRSIGGRWVIGELRTLVPGMGPMHAVLTLGYNAETGTYQGTWVDSVSDHLWVYEGTLDADARILTLQAEGPNMMDPAGGTAMYRDVIEIKSADHRTLTSFAQVQGEWVQFGSADYHRDE